MSTHDGDGGSGVAQGWLPYSNNRLSETCSLGLPNTSWILDIHVMFMFRINRHLSKHGIHWPVTRDHIMGSSLDTELKKADHTVNNFPVFHQARPDFCAWRNIRQILTVNPNRTVSLSKFSFFKPLLLLIRTYQVLVLLVCPFALSRV